MPGRRSYFRDSSLLRQMVLSRWANEGRAGLREAREDSISDKVQSDVPELTNAELVQLRVRVMVGELNDHVARTCL
jgi:hypothetical protein